MNLGNLNFFNKERITRLNNLIAVNNHLMPHVVASGTGCSLDEAMTFLVFLYAKKKANGYILIYHAEHLDFPFEKRLLIDGLPKGEVFCNVCEETILENDLLYDFEFVLVQNTMFEL